MIDQVKDARMNKLSEDFEPVKCKIDFIALNSARIPLKNHSMMLGAIYGLFAQIDPVFTYKHHKSTVVKPWSFSLLKFYNKPWSEAEVRNDFIQVDEGTRGYFFIKSIRSDLDEMIKEFSLKGKIFHVGNLKMLITKIETHWSDFNKNYPNIDTIALKLEAPTFFYDARECKLDPFTIETFFNYQCEKFKQLNLFEIDPELLYPYAWILKKELKQSWGAVTNWNDPKESLIFNGWVGTVKFKIVGNILERTTLWKLFYLSEFTGIGTRTSMGFGHNSFAFITEE
ncbi:MAG: CRISPR system precrRNA processing endoribonuclease RAMP protein Cas6 [Candidatus Lokiarchaeota archaeon]|nr:CRISPR system precrRNA processing endoribonuclease RAMP protein Cas6 [Candidatus Lokiarchaeota archaeon]